MDVFVVTVEDLSHGGSWVEGVYSTAEKAHALVERAHAARPGEVHAIAACHVLDQEPLQSHLTCRGGYTGPKGGYFGPDGEFRGFDAKDPDADRE